MTISPSRPRTAVVVVAAGQGVRMGGGERPKQYRPLAGKPLLVHTLDALTAIPSVDTVVPVIGEDQHALYDSLDQNHPKLTPAVSGGASRQASVLAGLEALVPLRPLNVLIHDAARPFVDAPLLDAVVAALNTADGALPALPVTDTIKRAPDGKTVERTEDRTELFAAQTPQGFRFDAILAAHRRAAALSDIFTDDAAIAEWAGLHVVLTPGSHRNIKITHVQDLTRAERMIWGETAMETRVGSGFDVHAFAQGDTVILGNIAIPHTARLSGHSDADVVLHALSDALYGALAEGDIGQHFPPTEMEWKGADSRIFIEHAAGRVRARGGRVVHLDVTIVCERPKIGPHVDAMRARIAELAGIATERVAVKATTSERLGFTGREEGLAAQATATIELPRGDD